MSQFYNRNVENGGSAILGTSDVRRLTFVYVNLTKYTQRNPRKYVSSITCIVTVQTKIHISYLRSKLASLLSRKVA